ncbi:helix-turn-helix domain-containing protein [Pelagovum sp. HNIBRBA483]|uniref:helix-turn-helix transcriptional regulator n=1 Tax=Pelagovum sp. HNIBRBA483 TaxID=3233341 RepID=UPI0034A0D8BA
MQTKHLFFKDILKDGAVAHLTRAVLDSSRPQALHDHDFYELLWVQNGKVRHHTTSGRTDLTEGDLIFVRPGQAHGLQGRGEAAMVVSLTLHPAIIMPLAERYAGFKGHFFWADRSEPDHAHRDMRSLAALNHAALRLEQARPDALEVDALLLPLLAALREERPRADDPTPDWLLQACSATRRPDVFRQGAAGLVAQTGRAHAHVSRSLRRYLGQTPSEFVNDIRMAYAARRLAGTEDTLAEIASDCGIPNLSHFHKQFRASHGVTPHRYRKQHQREVVQP